MAPLPKRGPGGRFLPRKSAAAARNAGARTAKRKNSAELLILNSRKQRSRPSEGRGRKRNSAELLILGNPKRKRKGPPVASVRGARGRKRKRLNPDQQAEAVALYEKFHGKTPTEILEIQESAAIRRDLAALGELVSLLVIDASGKTVQLEFPDDGVKVASSPKGTQLYLIGGNQNIGNALGQFEADASKDFIELGECREIVYTTNKEFDKFQTIDYAHEFGEEGGARPRLIYARLAKRLMLAGGDYKVDAPGIIN